MREVAMFEFEDVFADSVTTAVYLYATVMMLALCAVAALAMIAPIGTRRHGHVSNQQNRPPGDLRRAA